MPMNPKRLAALAACVLVSTAAHAQPPERGPSTPRRSPGQLQSVHQDIRATLGLVPTFLKQVPDAALPGAWQAMKEFQLNPDTRLTGKQKELIGLAVAAQIPCEYCVWFHTEAARLNGATDQELKEAIGMAALTRTWSTLINGAQPSQQAFRADIDRMMGGQAQGGAGGAGEPGGKAGAQAGAQAQQEPEPERAQDARQARAQMQQAVGQVPGFTRTVPDAMLPGLWNEWRALELSSQTALEPKLKSLIALGVAAQVPCEYCIYADKKSALQAGASQAEVDEAIAMAAITRHWSTLLNGSQLDPAQFRREGRQIFQHFRRQQQKDARGVGGAGKQR